MAEESLKDYIEAQKVRMKELRAEMDQVLRETRERVEAEQGSFFTTLTMSSVDVASWPEWMKSDRLRRDEPVEPPDPEPEVKDDDTFPCPKCKDGRMIDLGDGRSGYCPNCEATLFI